MKSVTSQNICANVCNFWVTWNICSYNRPFMNIIKHKVAVYFNMFGVLIKDWVCDDMDASLIVTIKCHRFSVIDLQIWQKVRFTKREHLLLLP